MRKSLSAAGALSAAVILLSCVAQTSEAATFVGGTNVWTLVGTPSVQTLGFAQAAATTIQSHLDVSVLGIVIMVLRNNLGQTVYYSTATMNMTHGMYATAYTVAAGVAPGIYNATIFAISTSGIAISESASISFPAR